MALSARSQHDSRGSVFPPVLSVLGSVQHSGFRLRAPCPSGKAACEPPAPASQPGSLVAVSLPAARMWGFLHNFCPGCRQEGVARWGLPGQV